MRVLIEETTFILSKMHFLQLFVNIYIYNILNAHIQNDIAKLFLIGILECMSTEDNTPSISKNPEDYDVFDKQALAKYTTDTGKILLRKYTGLTPMQQRKVSKLIKKARHLQLLH